MSRSYKRYPIIRQERPDKTILNRKLRRKKLWNLRGSQYKKVVRNFDDWGYRWSLYEALHCRRYKARTDKDQEQYWKKCCIRK